MSASWFVRMIRSGLCGKSSTKWLSSIANTICNGKSFAIGINIIFRIWTNVISQSVLFWSYNLDKNYFLQLGQIYVRIIRNGLWGNSTVKWWSSMARHWQVSFSEWECHAKKENRKCLFGQYSPFLRAVFLFASYYCKRIWQQ